MEIDIVPDPDTKTLVKQENYAQFVEELNSRMEERKGKPPDNYKQMAIVHHEYFDPGGTSPFYVQDKYTKERTEEAHGHQERASSGLYLNSRSYFSPGPDKTSPETIYQAVILSGRGSVWEEESGRVHPQEKGRKEQLQDSRNLATQK